jgi:RND family efflux transporter MFP subunit
MTDPKPDLASLRIDRAARDGRRPGWWFWASLVILVAVGASAGSWYLAGPAVKTVTVAVAVERQPSRGGETVLNASGYVTARRRATVSSKITGKVVEVNVEEGMRVREGQVLARLDDSIARAGLELAQAQLQATRQAVRESEVRLDEAQLTLSRRRQLLADGVIGQADLDAAQAEVDSLRARIAAQREQTVVGEREVALARTQLDDTVIRAPFGGVAISKDAQPGEMVSPVSAGGGFTRTGISTIVDMSSLEIEVDVNESYINRVEEGQAITATLDAYPDWRIPGRVITTVPTADRQKATVLVRIAFDALDPRILPDMGVKVAFLQDVDGSDEARSVARIVVPASAPRSVNGSRVVFVIKQDRHERRPVTLGAVDGEWIEVLTGLAVGERIVVDGPPDLTDGDRVAAAD